MVFNYEEIEKRIKKEKPLLSKGSVRAYMISYRKIQELVKFKVIDDFINHPQIVINAINDGEMSVNTKKNRLSGLINVIMSVFDESKKREDTLKQYRKALFDYKKNLDKTKEELGGGLSEKDLNNFINYDNVKHTFNYYNIVVKNTIWKKKELIPAERQLLQKYIAISLYSLLPPGRNEFSNTIVMSVKDYSKLDDKEKQEDNYLVFNGRISKVLYINRYKTEKLFGSREYHISKDGVQVKVNGKVKDTYRKKGLQLNTILNYWRKHNKGMRYLFYTLKGTPMKSNTFTKFLYRVFHALYPEKNVGSNIVRKAFHSTKEKQEFKKQYQKNKKDASVMGHSIDEAMETYSKKVN